MTRVDLAQEHIQRLHKAIADARVEFSEWEAATLDAYLAPLVLELDGLREAVDRELDLGRVRAGASEQTWVSIAGGRVRSGRAPANALGAILHSIQKGVRQIAAYEYAGRTFPSRIPEFVADASELDVVAMGVGSMRVALVPSIPQLDALQGATTAEAALRMLIEVASWAESGAVDDALDQLLPDLRLRRQIATRIREIAPSGRGPYETIKFYGFALPEAARGGPVSITRDAFDRATEYLETRQREDVAYRGQLVAIDVERDVFDLRFENVRIHCHFGADLLESAKGLIQEFVQVEGEGVFQLGGDHPTRIDATSVRRLTMEEQASLP